jgi:uncharacterized membrane protein
MSKESPNARLEAFSDGVFAIAITLLILEIKVPPIESIHSLDDGVKGLMHLWPSFFAFILSFIYVFLSWIGHHQVLKMLDKTSSYFQWSNALFLLAVTFIPFPTAFMAEYLATDYAVLAIVFYCAFSMAHNIIWNIFMWSIFKPKLLTKSHHATKELKKAHNGIKAGFFINLAIVTLSFWYPYTAIALNTLLWILWAYLSMNTKVEAAVEAVG